MGKLVYESLDAMLEGKGEKSTQSKKADIKDKIKGLETQLADAEGPGSIKSSKIQKDKKVQEIKDKIAKFKAKMDESVGEHGYDRDNMGTEHHYDYDDEGLDIDSPNYWELVAAEMNGDLVSFDVDHDRETRRIVINVNGRKIVIKHDWREDGSETKPWTYVNGDDKYGRLPIWEDDPRAYAEDILAY